MSAVVYFAVLITLFWISIKVFSINQLPINKLRMVLVYCLLTLSQHIMGLFLVEYYKVFVHLFMSIFYVMTLATLVDFFIGDGKFKGFKITNFYYYAASAYGFFIMYYHVRKGNYIILHRQAIYWCFLIITGCMIIHIFYMALSMGKVKQRMNILCNFILYFGLSLSFFTQVLSRDIGNQIFTAGMLVFIITIVIYSLLRFYLSGNELLSLSREQVLDYMDEMLIIVDEKMKIIDINQVFKDTFDVNKSALGMNLQDFFKSLPNVSEQMIDGILKDNEAKISFVDDNGIKTYSIKISHIKNSMNRVIGHMVLLYDITKMKEAMDYLEFVSNYDKLTMVHNRNYFDGVIADLDDDDDQLPISIIIGDLNGLKITNDFFGHEKGDQFLKDIALILKQNALSKDGVVARTGGDEFALILPKVHGEEAEVLASQIDAQVKEKLKDSVGSISLGVATKLLCTDSLHDVLQRADEHMYKKKQQDEIYNRDKMITSAKKWLSDVSYETEEHYEIIENHIVKLAMALDIPSNLIDDVRNLAHLHDIGKYFVSKEILEKDTPLNSEEWESIKKHTIQGYKLASSTNDLASVASGILSHHEHYDGTGYPQGLKGEQIPYLARMFTVVDAYCVMTAARPYRVAKTSKEAIEEIRSNRGTQFDPHIADVFISLIDRELEENNR